MPRSVAIASTSLTAKAGAVMTRASSVLTIAAAGVHSKTRLDPIPLPGSGLAAGPFFNLRLVTVGLLNRRRGGMTRRG